MSVILLTLRFIVDFILFFLFGDKLVVNLLETEPWNLSKLLFILPIESESSVNDNELTYEFSCGFSGSASISIVGFMSPLSNLLSIGEFTSFLLPFISMDSSNLISLLIFVYINWILVLKRFKYLMCILWKKSI